MRLKRAARALLLLLSALIAVSFASCSDGGSDAVSEADVGSGEIPYADLSIALVRDPASYAYAAENSSVSKELSSFATERGYAFSEFTAGTPSEEARLETVNTAVTLGANVVVCVGRYMQSAVMTAQSKYPETAFLVLLAEEANETDEVTAAENTHLVVFREEDAGYVAAYAALYEGSRTPAFFAFSPTRSAAHCFGGFIAGIKDAANELGIDGVKVICSVENDSAIFAPDGSLSGNSADDLFAEGADLIVAMGAQVNVSEEACFANGAKLIPVCFDAEDDHGVFSPYPRYDCAPAAKRALERLSANGGKWSVRDAGTYGREGLAEGCITLSRSDGVFGGEELQKIAQRAENGEIRIPLCENADDAATDGVQVIYIGQ